MMRSTSLLAFAFFAASVCLSAQDNYEIQVYGYDMVAPAHTMVELHSNFTVDGSKTAVDGVLPATRECQRPSPHRITGRAAWDDVRHARALLLDFGRRRPGGLDMLALDLGPALPLVAVKLAEPIPERAHIRPESEASTQPVPP